MQGFLELILGALLDLSTEPLPLQPTEGGTHCTFCAYGMNLLAGSSCVIYPSDPTRICNLPSCSQIWESITSESHLRKPHHEQTTFNRATGHDWRNEGLEPILISVIRTANTAASLRSSGSKRIFCSYLSLQAWSTIPSRYICVDSTPAIPYILILTRSIITYGYVLPNHSYHRPGRHLEHPHR